jgi:cation-transporting ATPase E
MIEAPEPAAARIRGLTAGEVAERSSAGATNRYATEATKSYFRIVIDNAFPAANVALVAVSFVLVGLGLYIDALLTAGLVAGNIGIGVIQESRAKLQLERIAVLARSGARVIRDGREQIVDSEDIVLDDMVVVLPGEQVQADGIVVAQDNCAIDESLLTGESDLVRKKDGDNVYSGTFCMGGRAMYRCQRVGREGLANQIAATARSSRVVRTPLQREVGYVMWFMAALVGLLSIEVVESLHEVYGRLPLVETTRAAAVLVALIPQGLWAMVTVTYAMAIIRMSRRGTLVQRSNAIESISHIDVLCLDKTGTITTNALTLEKLHPIEVDDAVFRSQLASFCASVSAPNRTNQAICSAIGGEARGVAAEVHFDSARKWSALAFDDDRVTGTFVLGAPEVLAGKLTIPRAERQRIDEWTRGGLRVLLFARASTDHTLASENGEPQLPGALSPLGFVVLRDELRPGIQQTIAGFADAGVELKIISGDNPETVGALAIGAGVPGAKRIISGFELAGASEEAFRDAVQANVVFGRVSPEQKARIVEALKREGRYVAMIGDGVNDVPALKRSHVAIALRTGSAVARSIADVVLLDDSFFALPAAFSEGRRIRNGMQAIVRLFLIRALSVSLVILGAGLLSSQFPLTPRHTAILSALTVGIPGLFLALWARPAVTDRYLIPSAMAFVLPASLLLGLMGTAVFEVALDRHGLDEGRTVLTSAAIIAGALLIAFVNEGAAQWLTWRGLLQTTRNTILAATMLALFGVTVLVDPARRFYELTPLGVEEALIVATGVLGWVAVLAVAWRLLARRLGRLPSRSQEGS